MGINESQYFSINETPSPEEIKHISEAVENHKRSQTNGEYDLPGVDIKLVLKDADGFVQGGVTACTIYRVMHLDVLWVADKYRRHGYGSQLVLGAEKIGLAKGCITSQTWTFSFQGPEFYPTIGYEQIGVYDGYPYGITEHAFMKQLNMDQAHSMELSGEPAKPDAMGLCLSTDVSEEDEKILHEGLQRHVKAHVGDEDITSTIELVMKDGAGDIKGGLFAWTTLCNLIFEHIWIEEGYRRVNQTTAGIKLSKSLSTEKLLTDSNVISNQSML